MIFKRKPEIIQAIDDELDRLGPIYIYTTSFEEKWNAFISKDVVNCLVRVPIRRFEDKKLDKYFKKRFLQCYSKAYKLLTNDSFIKQVIKFAKQSEFDYFIFGISPQVREHFEEILNGNEDINIPVKGKLFSGDRTPVEYYYQEIRGKLSHMCFLYFETKDHYYINKHKEKFPNGILDPTKNKYAHNMPSEKYARGLKKLMKNFGLSFWWNNSITLLLLTGRLFPPENFCPVNVEREHDEVSVSIPIAPETQLEDVMFSWDKIQYLKKDFLGNNKGRFSSKELAYLSKSRKKNAQTPYSVLVDYENIPLGHIAEEQKAFERVRKGIQRAKKWTSKRKRQNPVKIPIIKWDQKRLGIKEGHYTV